MIATMTELFAECERLKRTMRYNKIGFHYWPEVKVRRFVPEGPSECGICTNGAKIIAARFDGYVAGYTIHPDESRRLVGADCFGHDFAVVGNFIVDWWGWEYEQSIFHPVIEIGSSVAAMAYKPVSEWQTFPHNDWRPSRAVPCVGPARGD